jgi:hypothetical protein
MTDKIDTATGYALEEIANARGTGRIGEETDEKLKARVKKFYPVPELENQKPAKDIEVSFVVIDEPSTWMCSRAHRDGLK